MSTAYGLKDLGFVICAYGESPYLEACVRSLLRQALKGNISIATPTPSAYIDGIAGKYGIPVFVRKERGDIEGSIAADWNYAYSLADTPLVTLAHQDDVYGRRYAERVLEALNRAKRPLIAFTDYGEIRGGRFVRDNRLLWIKRLMLLPLRARPLQSSVTIRRRILSLGSPICCPSVCYVREHLPEVPFKEGYRTDLDWQAWEAFSKLEGDFVFVPRVLMGHRIHEGAETSRMIREEGRGGEDLEMFERFWPKRIANLLAGLYSGAERLY